MIIKQVKHKHILAIIFCKTLVFNLEIAAGPRWHCWSGIPSTLKNDTINSSIPDLNLFHVYFTVQCIPSYVTHRKSNLLQKGFINHLLLISLCTCHDWHKATSFAPTCLREHNHTYSCWSSPKYRQSSILRCDEENAVKRKRAISRDDIVICIENKKLM